MNMAQVRKYQNAAGPLPTKKKWNYKGKDYEVTDEQLKNITGFGMDNYDFDPNVTSDYNGIPSSKDILARELGIITKEQFDEKYTPTEMLDEVTVVATQPKKTITTAPKTIYNRQNVNRDELRAHISKRITDSTLLSKLNEGFNKNLNFNYDEGSGIWEFTDNEGKVQIDNRDLAASSGARNWGAFFNSKNHQRRVDNLGMRGFTGAPDVTQLRRADGEVFQYDEEGNLIDSESELNRDRYELIKDFRGWMDDTNRDKNYGYNNWKGHDKERARLLELANEFGETGLNELVDRIKTNQLSESDKQVLGLMGFGYVSGLSTDATPVEEKPYEMTDDDYKKVYEKAGSELSDTQKSLITKGEDGYYYISGDYATGAWDLVNNPYLDGLKFELALNGRLYNKYDHNNGELRNAFGNYFGYDNSDYNTYYQGRDNTKVRFYGDSEWQQQYYGSPDPYYGSYSINDGYVSGLTEYLRSQGLGNDYSIGVADITNDFDNLTNGYKVYQILQGNKNGNRTATRRETPLYLSVGPNGAFTMGLASNWNRKAIPQNPSAIGLNEYDENGYALYHSFGKGHDVGISRDGFYAMKDGSEWKVIKPEKVAEVMDAIRKGVTVANNPNFNKKQRSWYKEGGKINWDRLAKLQEGGVATRFESSGKKLDQTSGVSKDHKMNGKDGGLTTSEWMQFGAAAGDLIGVGTSFIPVYGNAISTATGLAASATQFGADIAQDHFDFGDLKRFGINIGLDLASLIPGLGTGAKTSKTLKTVKKIAPIAIMVLSGLGIAPAVESLSKVVKGEDLTSQDWTNILNGMSALIGGSAVGKAYVKESKAIAKELKTSLEADATAFKAKQEIVLPGKAATEGVAAVPEKKVIMSKQEALDLVNQNGNSYSKTKAAFEKATGHKFDNDEFETILSKLDINTKSKYFAKNKSGQAEVFHRGTVLKTPEVPGTHNTWHYLRPGKHVQGMGRIAGNTTFKDVNNAYNVLHGQSVNGMDVGRARLIQDAALNYGTRSTLQAPTSEGAWTFGGNKHFIKETLPYEAPDITTHEVTSRILTDTTPIQTPKPKRKSSPRKPKAKTEEVKQVTPVIERSKQPYNTPAISNIDPSTYRILVERQIHENLRNEAIRQQFLNSLTAGRVATPKQQINIAQPYKMELSPIATKGSFMPGQSFQKRTKHMNGKHFKEGGQIPMFWKGSVIPGTDDNINTFFRKTGTYAADLGRLFLTNNNKRRNADILKSAIIDTPLVAQRMQQKRTLYGPEQVFINQANDVLSRAVPQTRDQKLNVAGGLEIAKQKSDNIMTGAQQFSNRFENDQLYNLKAGDFTYNAEAGVANQRMQDRKNNTITKAELDVQTNDIIDAGWQNLLQSWTQAGANRNSALDALILSQAKAKYNESVKTNPEEALRQYRRATRFVKNGGTLSAQEKIQIDAHKESKKAIAKMNDSLSKMLLKLMK